MIDLARDFYFIECLWKMFISEEVLLFVLFEFSFNFVEKIVKISDFFYYFSVVVRILKNALPLSGKFII